MDGYDDIVQPYEGANDIVPPYEGATYDDDDARIDENARGEDTVECDAEDAAFILGKGGTTKQKISRVSGADIELDEKANLITVMGTAKQRRTAKDYIQFVIQQRRGNVEINLDSGRDDMTVVRVPSECVAFVMGRGGQTLR